MSALLPPNEFERLQALWSYGILDTPPEIAFERLTSLAAQLFDAPIAHVSLVDADRQWLKSCFGTGAEQIDRKLSFCAHAILSDEVMYVPDTHRDLRFACHELVLREPYIRSYLGAPLKTPSGHNLGTLCVIDRVPREYSAEQMATLENLAAMVVDEMELRRVARELREREATLQESLRISSQLTVAVTNLTSGVTINNPNIPGDPIVFANEGFYEMTGYGPNEIIGHNYGVLRGPETDREIVEAIEEAVKARRAFAGVLQCYRKDGTPFLNEVIINPVFDNTGELMSFVTVQNDVTQREQDKQVMEQRVSERTQELAHSQIEILDRLARAAEFRDDDTGQHTHRVAYLAARLAQELGLPPEQVTLIEQAAPLHDVGKIAISDLILLKPGKLTDEEFATMKTHAAVGAALLSNGRSEAVQMAERIAGSHHERWNGKGYPKGLAGEDIPLEGRILAVVDVFDALTNERPYKKAWSVKEALDEIERQSGQQFDPRVVEAFLKLPHEELGAIEYDSSCERKAA